MINSKIEWTDDTSNIVRIKGSRAFYCVKISPGCKHCYAEVMSRRLAGMGHDVVKYYYKVMENPPELELRRDIMKGWAQLKKPRKLFVSSMTDVFLEYIPVEWIYEMLDAMCAAPLQTFQVLTKRAARMRWVVDDYCKFRNISALPENIWLMVSVEDQQRADERVPELLATPCLVRGLSCEPLLEPVNLGRYCQLLDWVIVGGESGHGARPMHLEWARLLRDQCIDAGVPFFFKQWGEWAPHPHEPVRGTNTAAGIFFKNDGTYGCQGDWWDGNAAAMDKVGKHAAGNLLDGIVYNEFPKIIIL